MHKLPSINSGGDLKEALQKLGSLPQSKIMVRNAVIEFCLVDFVDFISKISLIVLQAVEVLWTPQNENDTLTERQLLEDYPLLRPL